MKIREPKYEAYISCFIFGVVLTFAFFIAAQSTPEFTPSEVWLSTYNDQGVRHDFLKLHTQDKIRVTQREDGVLVVLVHEDEDFDFAINLVGVNFRVKHWQHTLTLSHWIPSWPWRGWIMQYAERVK